MKNLLAIVEQGGYPDFTPLFESLGYQVTVAPSMRKALNILKQLEPDVITAEFIYSPMYSARISNLESLFATLQNRQLNPQLVIYAEAEQRHHLDKLETEHLNLQTITYPIEAKQISHCLCDIAITDI